MHVKGLVAGMLALYASAAVAEDALLSAVRAKQVEKVRRLLKKGADVQARDELGQTALHLAVENDDADMIEALVRGGAVVDARSETFDSTPLADAVVGKKRRAVEALLRHRPALVQATEDPTLLILAAERGDGATLKLLLAAGMDPTRSVTHKSVSNVNALMAAAGEGNAETVKVLLETSVDVNQRDTYGDHCLNWAVGFGKFHVVPLLLDAARKVELNFVGYEGQTALDMAIAKNHAPTIELLRQRGAKRARDP